MKLTGYQIFDLLSGLRGLDGDPENKVAPMLKFGGTITYTLSKNLRRVTDAAAALEHAKNRLVRQYELDKSVDSKDEMATATRINNTSLFKAEWDKVLQEQVDIVLSGVKVSELKLDENRIPLQVLANLEAILQEG